MIIMTYEYIFFTHLYCIVFFFYLSEHVVFWIPYILLDLLNGRPGLRLKTRVKRAKKYIIIVLFR